MAVISYFPLLLRWLYPTTSGVSIVWFAWPLVYVLAGFAFSQGFTVLTVLSVLWMINRDFYCRNPCCVCFQLHDWTVRPVVSLCFFRWTSLRLQVFGNRILRSCVQITNLTIIHQRQNETKDITFDWESLRISSQILGLELDVHNFNL